jgi:ABC-type transporter Mla subunit MlaD
MAKSNLSQHEQLLKALEKSIREISEKQNEVDDTLHQAWALSNTVRNMTMQLFVMADDLRSTRLDFEKAEGQ